MSIIRGFSLLLLLALYGFFWALVGGSAAYKQGHEAGYTEGRLDERADWEKTNTWINELGACEWVEAYSKKINCGDPQ